MNKCRLILNTYSSRHLSKQEFIFFMNLGYIQQRHQETKTESNYAALCKVWIRVAEANRF